MPNYLLVAPQSSLHLCLGQGLATRLEDRKLCQRLSAAHPATEPPAPRGWRPTPMGALPASCRVTATWSPSAVTSPASSCHVKSAASSCCDVICHRVIHVRKLPVSRGDAISCLMSQAHAPRDAGGTQCRVRAQGPGPRIGQAPRCLPGGRGGAGSPWGSEWPDGATSRRPEAASCSWSATVGLCKGQ